MSTGVGTAGAGEEGSLTLLSELELELPLTGQATLTDGTQMRVSDVTSLRRLVTAQAYTYNNRERKNEYLDKCSPEGQS